MAKHGEGKSVGDWPNISENHWYALALASAVLTAVAVCAAFIYIAFDGVGDDGDVERAQTLAPFGVALFALVTFCTVSWRGSINARQANQAESEGRAKLLQEGAKLLSEAGKASHVSAGVATLGVLVSGDEKVYAFRAMNLLADFVEDQMSTSHNNRHRPEISGVLQAGDENGANTGREISFYEPIDETNGNYYDDDVTSWHYIPGFAKINYRGGEFSSDPHYHINDLSNVEFNHVTISNWNDLIVDNRFWGCSFRSCSIKSISSLSSLRRVRDSFRAFTRCDFSDCVIDMHNIDELNLNQGENYFIEGHPPIAPGDNTAAKWSEILSCVAAKPEFTFLV